MNCTHELGEREAACADGYCPICLAEKNTMLSDTLDYLHGLTPAQAAAERADVARYRLIRRIVETRGRIFIDNMNAAALDDLLDQRIKAGE